MSMPVANTKVVQGQGGREPKQATIRYFMADEGGVTNKMGVE